MLKREIMTAFQYDNLSHIACVYPKIKSHTFVQVENLVTNLLNYIPANNKDKFHDDDADIDNMGDDNIDDDYKDNENENDDLNSYGEEGSKNNDGDLEQVVKYYGKRKSNLIK